MNPWNRSGNDHTAHSAVGFPDQTCRELPPALKVRRVLTDNGFCDNGFRKHWNRKGPATSWRCG